MLKNKRYIYLGDIHGSPIFPDFIKKFNDNNTLFYLLGDLFDRGLNSYKNYLLIKDLYNQNKLKYVIGNHDVFFIMRYGLEEGGTIKKILLENNIDNVDILNLKEHYMDMFYLMNDNIGNTETQFPGKKELIEAANWLFEHGEIMLKDEFNNILIHGGIPILKNGEIVTYFDENTGKKILGINFVEYLSKGFKEMKSLTPIFLLDRISYDKTSLNSIYNFMLRHNLIKKQLKNIKIKNTSPIRYENLEYDKNDDIYNSINSHLNEYGINKLIVGHWYNKEIDVISFNDINSDYWKNRRIVRLDRGHIYLNDDYPSLKNFGNFGYMILDDKNNITGVGDAKNIIKF